MEFIEEQIDSILSQKNVSIAIFVSVDYSEDNTYEWVCGLSQLYPFLHVLPYGERYGGAAKNFFRLIKDVDFSGFDYVSFADQDDIWMPDKLSRSIDSIKKGFFSAYSSNVIAFWPDGREKLVEKAQPQKKWDYLFEAAGPGCTYVLTAELAKAIKNFITDSWVSVQDIYLHDWLVYSFARANDYKWFIDNLPSMHYRQHNNNQVGMNLGFRGAAGRLGKILDGYGLEQSRRIAFLVGLTDDEFVLGWSRLRRLDILALAFKARSCRRRLRDQFYFFIVCILLSAIANTSREFDL